MKNNIGHIRYIRRNRYISYICHISHISNKKKEPQSGFLNVIGRDWCYLMASLIDSPLDARM